jgi:hypothetical protein
MSHDWAPEDIDRNDCLRVGKCAVGSAATTTDCGARLGEASAPRKSVFVERDSQYSHLEKPVVWVQAFNYEVNRKQNVAKI